MRAKRVHALRAMFIKAAGRAPMSPSWGSRLIKRIVGREGVKELSPEERFSIAMVERESEWRFFKRAFAERRRLRPMPKAVVAEFRRATAAARRQKKRAARRLRDRRAA